MRKCWFWAIVLTVLLLPGVASRADVIRLKNGNSFEGEIVSKSPDELMVDIPGIGTMTFATTEIATIEREAKGPQTYDILLKSGNRILADVTYMDDQRVEVSVLGSGTLTLGREDIAMMKEVSEEEAAAMHQQQSAKNQPDSQQGQQGARPVPVSAPISMEDDEMTRIEQEVQRQKSSTAASLDKARELAGRAQQIRAAMIPGVSSGTGRMPQGAMPSPEMLGAAGPVVQIVNNIVQQFFFWIMLGGFFAMIYAAFTLQKLAERTGTDGEWMAWIPIAHTYLACRVGNRPGWWFLLYMVPFINILIDILVWAGIARARAKSGWLGILVLVPLGSLFLMGYLAYSKDPQVQMYAAPKI